MHIFILGAAFQCDPAASEGSRNHLVNLRAKDMMGSDQLENRNTPEQGLLDGTLYGYGHWLDPIQAAFGNSAEQEGQPLEEVAKAGIEKSTVSSQRRGRGRPRVPRKRDDSAIEKRRAQIRSAQRTYRERKENATASLGQRCDDLLQVISDISSELEELLQVASSTGAMNQDNALGEKLRRMASCYDSAINEPCLSPELRLLQVRNTRRKEQYSNPSTNTPTNTGQMSEMSLPQETNTSHGLLPPTITPTSSNTFQSIDLNLGRTGEFTLIQSFIPFRSALIPADRSIIEIIKERQRQNP